MLRFTLCSFLFVCCFPLVAGRPALKQVFVFLSVPRVQHMFKDSRDSCDSHYVLHFAVFFILARTKVSVVWSCFCLLKLYIL